MQNRRGFLKTLGKLTAAVGITAAATVPTKGKELNHDEVMEAMEVPKDALLDFKPDGTVIRTKLPNAASLEATSRGWPRYESKNTMMKKLPPGNLQALRDTTRNMQAQQAMDKLENLRLDNLQMRLNQPVYLEPDRFISPHLQHLNHTAFGESVRISHRAMLLKELDQFNWGGAFELRWSDWKPDDPRHDTVCGYWTAKVLPRYSELFGNQTIFTRKVVVSRHAIYMAQEQDRKETLQDWYKRTAYEDVVHELRDAIQFIVAAR